MRKANTSPWLINWIRDNGGFMHVVLRMSVHG
jgi:hypothetical protein